MIRKPIGRGFGLAALLLFCAAVFLPAQPALAVDHGDSAVEEQSWLEVFTTVWKAVVGSDGDSAPAAETNSTGENEGEPADIGASIDPNGG